MQEKNKGNILTIVLCALFVLISSCIQPYDDIEYISTETVDDELSDVQVYRVDDSDGELESSEEEQSEQEIVEEQTEEETMMIKAIDEYEGYAFADGKLKGINGNAFYSVDVVGSDNASVTVSDFYKSGTSLYFKVDAMEAGDAIPDTDTVQYESVKVSYYFKQTGTTVEEIQETDFSAPASEYVEMEEDPFKIYNYDYNGIDTSRVQNGPLINAYLKIDGYMKNSAGLWFSVSETYGTLKSGLYFWSNDDTASRRKGEYGRVF